jgi:hypothetical protein
MSSSEHQQYDEQLVIRYLLGSVPEAEAERLDELSVADEEFANRLAAVENDLVDAYVRGELAGETRDRFQSYYLCSSRRCEKVNFAEALLVVPVPNSAPEGVPARTSRKRDFSRAFAAAACLASLAACLFLYQNSQLRNELVRSRQKTAVLEQSEREARTRIERQPQAAKIARGLAIVLTPQLRGAGPATAVAIHPGSLEADFQLELEPGDFTDYRARLRAPAAGQVIWQSGALTAATRGESRFVPLSLPAGVLKPGNYTLELSGTQANGSPEFLSSYAFTVVP